MIVQKSCRSMRSFPPRPQTFTSVTDVSGMVLRMTAEPNLTWSFAPLHTGMTDVRCEPPGARLAGASQRADGGLTLGQNPSLRFGGGAQLGLDQRGAAFHIDTLEVRARRRRVVRRVLRSARRCRAGAPPQRWSGRSRDRRPRAAPRPATPRLPPRAATPPLPAAAPVDPP